MSYSNKISLSTQAKVSFAKAEAVTAGEKALIEAWENMFTEKEKAEVEYGCGNDD